MSCRRQGVDPCDSPTETKTGSSSVYGSASCFDYYREKCGVFTLLLETICSSI